MVETLKGAEKEPCLTNLSYVINQMKWTLDYHSLSNNISCDISVKLTQPSELKQSQTW